MISFTQNFNDVDTVMNTLTKNCIAARISDNHFEGHFPVEAATALNLMLEVCVDALASNKQVAFKNFGKLRPRIKKEGRPVRNPKTGEGSVMPEIATVTMPASKGTSSTPCPIEDTQSKFNTSDITDGLRSRLLSTMQHKKCDIYKLADCTVKEFIAALIETEDCETRIEIRGFGTFRCKKKEPQPTRNPRTKEKVISKGGIRKHFKVSRKLREHIYPNLKAIVQNEERND